MTPHDNKRLIQHLFTELARGNRAPFADAMADDFAWTIPGTTAWSRTYRGKDVVRRELFRPLFAQLEDGYTNTAHRILADGDFVVVQCRGRSTTKAGRPYDNEYCYVIRLAGGQLRELFEYLDTELVATVLAPP
jgi:ketosteroid isomerase-like protein